jgi:hypothetical protein
VVPDCPTPIRYVVLAFAAGAETVYVPEMRGLPLGDRVPEGHFLQGTGDCSPAIQPMNVEARPFVPEAAKMTLTALMFEQSTPAEMEPVVA